MSTGRDERAEWFIAGVGMPVFVMLFPLFKGWTLVEILKKGELFVLAIVLSSSLLWSGLFRLKRKEDRIFWHVAVSIFALLFLVPAYMSRFQDEGNLGDLTDGWIALSIGASALTILLGLMRPTVSPPSYVVRIGDSDA